NSLKNHNEDRAPFEIKNVFYALKDGIWALLLPVVILGGIYSGFFTPTEAGAIAVVYAAIVEFFIHHELKISRIPQIFADSAQMMGTLFLIMIIAIAFTKFLTLEQIPQQAVQWIGGFIENKFTFLIAVNLFLLVIGCFMDVISAILILGPILAPMAMHYGIHSIHFGIIFIVNLQIGYCTPPIGLNLFVASSIFKRDLGLVIRSVVPFALILLVSLLIISYVPAISLVLLDVL
nr:TRAP transporter large permease [bacterium]